ncbi:MAG: rRNA pseudouridine synthase [Candidatus Jacksonbacteria bacterium]|jgi:23S rRNA pseudouridine2605 synthase|nr:rRNA pseudouridine synthase [Candidatus Jacksonbacteria bacterium]MBT6034145.1 rRNA pseudouridine synthase [Candidatus Jacksonbacteria bacterium]MBT6301292.1 rRNA pseudouridine synthase [Candidatus Jacksonbacteria bacterium]MBT6756834.1 rRNA pseudouridine synthase [Candidatus Jacksonbacteria bacterium]MBT6955008.1 rRNA pseudouridine synthase [Candidatus Jacksonbacteria bacterium]
MALERLQKILAHAGVASRRKAEELIKAGNVAVNGTVHRDLGIKADRLTDVITVEGKKIVFEDLEYYIVNKPKGVVSTVTDPQKRTTVVSLVTSQSRLYPVGRLDAQSHGLIILTNDGEAANKLTHPKYEHEKEYRVRVHQRKGIDRSLNDLVRYLQNGVRLDEGMAKADSVKIEIKNSEKSATILITLHQGWKRQIRRMVEKCGWYVGDLERIRIGNIELGDLKEGNSKKITLKDLGI